jgi:hypothetical protein
MFCRAHVDKEYELKSQQWTGEMVMFFITTQINGQVTGRNISTKPTQDRAEKELQRIIGSGPVLRPGESLCIVEATSAHALAQAGTAPSNLTTPDLMRAAILGAGSVMNRDFD